MRRVIFIFALLFVNGSLAADAIPSDNLALPLAVRQELTRWNFKFRPYDLKDFNSDVRELFQDRTDQQPMKLEGDFNGDKVNDYILIGEADKQQYVISLISDKSKFKSVVVRSWSRTDFNKEKSQAGDDVGVATYLAKVKPGEIPDRKQKYDLLQIETYAGATELFEIKNLKAKKLN